MTLHARRAPASRSKDVIALIMLVVLIIARSVSSACAVYYNRPHRHWHSMPQVPADDDGMSIPSLSILAGAGALEPVPAGVMNALEQVYIVTAIGERGSFRLTFRLDIQCSA